MAVTSNTGSMKLGAAGTQVFVKQPQITLR